MNPESKSTYFCRIWTPPYSLIIRNPAGNPTSTDIRHQGSREAPMKKRKEIVSFCVTMGRRSARMRKGKESEVDYVEDGMK